MATKNFKQGVFDISKIQIQKQITTTMLADFWYLKVYLIFQRYKFKSKSQRNPLTMISNSGVFDISKIQIQKQIAGT